jgi:hypothetical protein
MELDELPDHHRVLRGGGAAGGDGTGVVACPPRSVGAEGLPGFYRTVMDNDPIGPALPVAVGAWVLAAGGAIAAVFAGPAIPRLSRRGVPLLAVGAVLAVLVSVAVTVKALNAGDDSRFIDATTAAAVDIPASPTTLGQHRFTLTLPDAFDTASRRSRYEISPAGAGFVIFHDGRVAAYGNDGKERWHYRRTGPGDASVTAMRVYDGGRTVVISYSGRYTEQPGFVGLDALTGEQLWSRQDPQLKAAFYADSGLYDPDPFLVHRDEHTWTRFDARTGRPMWSVPSPAGDCDPFDQVDTASRLVSAVWCRHGDTVDDTILVVDPQTGEKLWQHAFLPGLPALEDTAFWQNFSVYPFPASFRWRLSGGIDQRPTLPQRLLRQRRCAAGGFVAAPRRPAIHRGTGQRLSHPAGSPCTRRRPGDAVRPGRRCEVHGDQPGQPGQHQPARPPPTRFELCVAADGFVLHDFGRYKDPTNLSGAREPSALRMFNNTACQETAQVPISAFLGLLAAPGVVLALRQDMSNLRTVLVEGYY